jgi:hypothetical protein
MGLRINSAKHLFFPTPYEKQILRLRLRMTLRHSLIGAKLHSGSQRPVVESPAGASPSPFIESARCGLLIASFHGDGAPWYAAGPLMKWRA